MNAGLELLRMRAEKVRDQATDIAAWFAVSTEDPPRELELNPEVVFALDRDVEQVGKLLMGGHIPADLWAPFWGSHMIGSRKNYSSDHEYWRAGVRHAGDTIAFINRLALLRGSGKAPAPQPLVAEEAADADPPGPGADKDTAPSSVQEALARIAWRLPPTWRVPVLVLAVAAMAVFAVWSSLPDDAKTSVVTRLAGKAGSSARSSGPALAPAAVTVSSTSALSLELPELEEWTRRLASLDTLVATERGRAAARSQGVYAYGQVMEGTTWKWSDLTIPASSPWFPSREREPVPWLVVSDYGLALEIFRNPIDLADFGIADTRPTPDWRFVVEKGDRNLSYHVGMRRAELNTEEQTVMVPSWRKKESLASVSDLAGATLVMYARDPEVPTAKEVERTAEASVHDSMEPVRVTLRVGGWECLIRRPALHRGGRFTYYSFRFPSDTSQLLESGCA